MLGTESKREELYKVQLTMEKGARSCGQQTED